MTSLTPFEPSENSRNLISFNQDDLEIYIDSDTGESFSSISGYARMSEKDKSTISRRLQGVAPEMILKAEVLTLGGLQGVALITESLMAEWLITDNPKLATKLLMLGIRKFLHGTADYQHNQPSEPPQATQPVIEPIKSLLADQADSEVIKVLGDRLKFARKLKDSDLVASMQYQFEDYIDAFLPSECTRRALLQAKRQKDTEQFKLTLLPKIDDVRLQIFIDLIRACKGEPRKVGYFSQHSLGKRKDVLCLYGRKNQMRITKVGIVLMWKDAAKYGYGTYNTLDSVFIPNAAIVKI